MRTFKFLVLTICFIIALLSLKAFISRNKISEINEITKSNGKGFAVLELFTSEGCSSCPPADDLMAKIQSEAGMKPIYILAYHVDYWDRQGWKDKFSSADFSNRQTQYGNWLNVSPIYTPQLIINGKTQFIGSDESAIRKEISAELSSSSNTTLTIQTQQNGSELTVRYQVSNATNNSSLLIAVLQKNAQDKVERGENAGRTLFYVQIVRKLQTESLNNPGGVSKVIELPKDFNRQNWEVVCFIQDQGNGRISAAAEAG
jgi:hypothetical protein